MNPDNQAWEQLHAHASAQLRSGFADRVLRAAKESVEAAPSVVSQFVLSAATAGLCFVAVALFQSREGTTQNGNSLAGWQEIAAATTADSSLGQ